MSVLDNLRESLPLEEINEFDDDELKSIETLKVLSSIFSYNTYENKDKLIIKGGHESIMTGVLEYSPFKNQGQRTEIQNTLRDFLENCKNRGIHLESPIRDIMQVATKSTENLIALYFHFNKMAS